MVDPQITTKKILCSCKKPLDSSRTLSRLSKRSLSDSEHCSKLSTKPTKSLSWLTTKPLMALPLQTRQMPFHSGSAASTRSSRPRSNDAAPPAQNAQADGQQPQDGLAAGPNQQAPQAQPINPPPAQPPPPGIINVPPPQHVPQVVPPPPAVGGLAVAPAPVAAPALQAQPLSMTSIRQPRQSLRLFKLVRQSSGTTLMQDLPTSRQRCSATRHLSLPLSTT